MKTINITNELVEALLSAQIKGIITSKERAVIDCVIFFQDTEEKDIAKRLEITVAYVWHIAWKLRQKNILRDGFMINNNYSEWKTLQISKETLQISKVEEAKNTGKMRDNEKTLQISKETVRISKVEPANTGKMQGAEDSLQISKVTKGDSITESNTHNNNNNINNNNKIIYYGDKFKQEKAKQLIKEFCALRNIPLDSGFFSKNIRSARSLVSHYPIEFILAGVAWRLQNDADGFWTHKLWSLNLVYSHFAEWVAESNLKSVKTFAEWLTLHPEQDYKTIKEPDAKLKAFFTAFNRALKEGITPTREEWDKYQRARELVKK